MAFGDVIRSAASPATGASGIGGDANTIWHCDYATVKLYELSTTDFSVVRSHSSPNDAPYDIGGDANTIWLCGINPFYVYELSTSDFGVVQSRYSPNSKPYGIGGDANTIWHCDYGLNRIYELSTTNLSIVRSGSSPSNHACGIGGDANTIWHSDYGTNTVYELSTTDFSVVRSAASPTGTPQGIGGNASTIWHCAGDTDTVYELDAAAVTAPTITIQAATNVQATTATGNGNVTNNGGENPDDRRIEWGTSSGSYPNSISAGAGGEGAFSCGLTGLPTGTTIYCRAKAHNSAGWGYSSELTFLTKPAAPTSVLATDGVHTDKVVITWTKATGATGYQVYRDGTPLEWLGDVATFNDTGAGAPTITPGAATASDGLYADKVALSLSGQSANNGAAHTYKVRARNATGESVDSGANTGYRGVGSLTYQWQRSAADSDADYSNIPGATTASYDDTGAPKAGGRYYRCVENATGATQQISSSDRGYRVGETTYDTMVGFPTGWAWEKCDYEVSEKCPVGLETSWAWKVPTLAGPDKTPQGSPTLFSWGSE